MKKVTYDKGVYYAAIQLSKEDNLTIQRIPYYADTYEKVDQWIKEKGIRENILIGRLPEEVIERYKGR